MSKADQRTLKRALVVAVVLATASGCTGLGRSRPTTVGIVPVSVEASVLRDPGDEVVPGLSVPDDTHLVGQAVPLIGYDEEGGGPRQVGWKALFLVGDDPLAAWSNMARELDVDEGAALAQACSVTLETAEVFTTGVSSGSRRLTEPPLDGENLLRCGFYNDEMQLSMLVGALLRCTGQHGAAEPCELIPVAHLRVIVDEPGGFKPKPIDKSTPAGRAVMPEFPDNLAAQPLLGPGGAADDCMDYHLWVGDCSREEDSAFVIPEGGRSVVAPVDFGECTGSVINVLEVDAPPPEAVELIAGQAWGDPEVATGQWDGSEWAYAQVEEAGGYHVTVTGVDRPDGGSTVWFSDCGD